MDIDKDEKLGVVRVPLENLSVYGHLSHLLMPKKIEKIAEDIDSRYDPSQGILVVAPERFSKSMDLKNIVGQRFLVIQKII